MRMCIPFLDGVVSEAGWDANGGGNYIKVKHSERFEAFYLLHLSKIYYKKGEIVKSGSLFCFGLGAGHSLAGKEQRT